jgi:hypothetical protein
MLKERDVAEDARIETVSSTNTEEAVNVEIARIVKEKHYVSNGCDDIDAVHDRASDDVDLVVMTLTLFVTELLMMLMKRKEWMCDFGVYCRGV